MQTSELSEPAGIIPTGFDTASVLSLLSRRPLSTCRAINDEVANKIIITNQLQYEHQGQTSFTIPSPPTHTTPAKKYSRYH